MPRFLLIVFLAPFVHPDDTYTVPNWKFHFVPGSGMGVFLAVATPLSGPYKKAYLAYNFEANYALPGNATSYEYPPLISRGIDRALVYSAIETKIKSGGYSGKDCLMRTICEASQHPTEHVNGVLGDIMHIIFTPSTSLNDGLNSDYEQAEKRGRNNDCAEYNKKCTVSFLDFISWIEQSI